MGLGWVESQPPGNTGHGVKTSAGIQASETGEFLAVATWTHGGVPFGFGCWWSRRGVEVPAGSGECGPCQGHLRGALVVAEDAVVPDLGEARRQDVKGESANELDARKGMEEDEIRGETLTQFSSGALSRNRGIDASRIWSNGRRRRWSGT